MTRPVELLRAAQRNLARIASGDVRRQREAAEERARQNRVYRKSLIEERQQVRAQLARYRRELSSLEDVAQPLYELHNQGKIGNQYGWLEEIDARISTLINEVIGLDDYIITLTMTINALKQSP